MCLCGSFSSLFFYSFKSSCRGFYIYVVFPTESITMRIRLMTLAPSNCLTVYLPFKCSEAFLIFATHELYAIGLSGFCWLHNEQQ